MLSRSAGTKGRKLEFGAFRLDAGDRVLRRGDEPVSVTPKALDTLEVLLSRAGEVVAKQDLLEAVWPETFVEEATLTQNIYTLRKVLGEDDSREAYIETVPRRGYRFVVPVRVVEERVDESAERRPTVESIAVLPFEPLGVGEEMKVLGLGMADALITRLSNLRSLAVRPTGATLFLSRDEREAVQVGRRLQVQAVLTGTVQRAGDRLRVTVQLVDGEQGSSLWAETFDTVYGDIFSVQDTISRRIAKTLHVRLTQRESERLGRREASSTEAYEAYIRGRYLWNRRTHSSLERAIASYDQALELDPDSALAYAGLAAAYVLLPLYGDTPPDEVFPHAREAASRALGLDPDLPEAHSALAYTRFVYDWRWSDAEDSFRRALDLNPNYATAYQWYSFMLTAQGRADEALEHAYRARELDPLSRVISSDLGFVLYFAGRYREAVRQHQSTLDLEGGFAYAHFGLSLAFAALDRHEEAVAEARRAVELSQGSSATQAVLGYALGRSGRQQEAEEVAAEIRSQSDSKSFNASRLALIYAGLGDGERTLDMMELACEQRSRFVAFLNVWPVYEGLRSHSRFQALVSRVGLEPRR